MSSTYLKCGSKSTTVKGKSCGDGKICNPETGRCVNKDGKIGLAAKTIWANDKEEKRPKSPRKSPVYRSPSPRRAEIPSIPLKNMCGSKSTTAKGKSCGDGKICNPETGRYVNRNGKLGLKILKMWNDMENEKQPKSPRNKSPRSKSPRSKSPRNKSPRSKPPRSKSPRSKSPRSKSPIIVRKSLSSPYAIESLHSRVVSNVHKQGCDLYNINPCEIGDCISMIGKTVQTNKGFRVKKIIFKPGTYYENVTNRLFTGIIFIAPSYSFTEALVKKYNARNPSYLNTYLYIATHKIIIYKKIKTIMDNSICSHFQYIYVIGENCRNITVQNRNILFGSEGSIGKICRNANPKMPDETFSYDFLVMEEHYDVSKNIIYIDEISPILNNDKVFSLILFQLMYTCYVLYLSKIKGLMLFFDVEFITSKNIAYVVGNDNSAETIYSFADVKY